MSKILIDDYMAFTRTVAKYPKEHEYDYLMNGFVGEVGEFFSAFAKNDRGDYGLDEAMDRARKEMGDLFWFMVRLCDHFGWSPEEIMAENRDKLTGRLKAGTIKGDGDER